MTLESAGTKVGEIQVRINYRFLELFSEGLYSSPNKAFEELVSNSYDAFATQVSIYVPPDKTSKDSVMWVCDNGESMDSDGLKLLWTVAASNKRTGSYDAKDRPPIGKFGIGKLATFVLCRKLTYICKKAAKFLAVTMDYGGIKKDSENYQPISMDERELTEDEARDILKPLIEKNGVTLVPFEMWGAGSVTSWTFAAMTDLTPYAAEIKEGRLNWVLRTALPLNPNFNLVFNGAIVESSKIDKEPWNTWIIGQNDKTAEKLSIERLTLPDGTPCVNLPSLKGIHGHVELYHDLLTTGKSEEFGRSNGFFVMVRKRLINLDDPLFGMAALSHGAFARFRMILNVDSLDEHLRSTREAIMDSPALTELKRYMQSKFEEVRSYYNNQLAQEEKEKQAKHKLGRTSMSLSRRPLLVIARMFFSGQIDTLVLTDISKKLDAHEQADFLKALEDDLTSEEGIIKEVEWTPLSPDDPIAKLDLMNRKVDVNLLHPFFANFMDELKSTLPFQLIAITEILTEAHLIELGVPQDTVRDIMWRRDEMLRELTQRDKPNAPLVAQLLQASLADSQNLETATFNAFSSLGFETTQIGVNGKPDGTAVAILGVRDPSTGKREDFKIVYDAKSTSKEKIKAITAHISGIKRHQEDYKADYSVVVAIDFEGGDDPGSAASKEATQFGVTLIRARDLMKLVLIASPKQIGFLDMRDLFDKCRTAKETSDLIDQWSKRAIKPEPIKELLDTVYKLMKEDLEPPDLSAIRMSNPTLKNMTKESLKTLVLSIERLVNGLLTLRGEIVEIQAPPERIIAKLAKATDSIPPEFLNIYLEAFK
ncbi:MAG: ATP-binding protein [Bacteroidetes bacterium]|nr:ATP-binding protein [Bacteroidota bacterium]